MPKFTTRFKEPIGDKGPVNYHLKLCSTTPSEDVISILGSKYQTELLLTLQQLFMTEIVPVLKR